MEQRDLVRRLALAAILVITGVAVAQTGLSRTQDERHPDAPDRVMVLDGSPVHNVGELKLHTGNWGGVGSWPGGSFPFSFAPSARWPSGSSNEYLFAGGLWVGAVVDGIPRVSTAAYEREFRPTPDPIDIVYRSAEGTVGGNRMGFPGADDDGDGSVNEERLDGHDNDGDGLIDEDFAAISNQMFSRWYTDDQPAALEDYPIIHQPLNLTVHEESYQWEVDGYDDFVGFEYWITNHGTTTLHDVYVGWLVDGDAGDRLVDGYWRDDLAASTGVSVDHHEHGTVTYDFAYIYDANLDNGATNGYFGLVVLDHPTDPGGVSAPTSVGAYTLTHHSNGQEDNLPISDLERYQVMSWGRFSRDAGVPRDYQNLVSVGPFSQLAPGQTIRVAMALVATPAGTDFTNVKAAARAYHGVWLDLDNNPATGANGKEHQVHWFPPFPPAPVFVTEFDASADRYVVTLNWQIEPDQPLFGFKLTRTDSHGTTDMLADEFLPARTRSFVDRTAVQGETYAYMLTTRGVSGWETRSPIATATLVPFVLELRQNRPNPFNSTTTVAFTLARSEHVELAVFATDGRRVATLVDQAMDAGDQEITWEGRDDRGQPAASGVYFYQLKAGGRVLSKKMVLLK